MTSIETITANQILQMLQSPCDAPALRPARGREAAHARTTGSLHTIESGRCRDVAAGITLAVAYDAGACTCLSGLRKISMYTEGALPHFAGQCSGRICKWPRCLHHIIALQLSTANTHITMYSMARRGDSCQLCQKNDSSYRLT